MSATLNAELFASYFDGAPLVHIPGRTVPSDSVVLGRCSCEDCVQTNRRILSQGRSRERKAGHG
ncbi:hypothetical protein BJ741DRAFT_438697 [Chytriomyces cf. hyalinus JEL632]|nr:hypothetical protein BJ741DRAFT_438697 [Chytriomyces cf. hyalinus JEL632]